MKVLLVANYKPDKQESMQRAAQLLESALTAAGHRVQVIRPTPVVGALKPGATGVSKWLGYVDKFLLFPQALRQAIAEADVVHICDHSNAFYTRYLQRVPHLVTCNDLLSIRSAQGEFPQNPTQWSGRQLQRWILSGLNRAQRVVCISEKTRQDLLRLSQLAPEATTVIYYGLNYDYAPLDYGAAREALVPMKIAPEIPYFLHVGGEHWYKNRLGAIQIFAQLRSLLQNSPDLYLVMAGAPLPQETQRWIQAHHLSDRIIEAVGVSNAQLQALYSGAMALLFPSLEEGFGWPILEAHACGCPVFTSDRAPMTEVGGNAAFYIDPEDLESSAAAIADKLPSLQESRPNNLLNAQRFNNAQMVERYLQEYHYAIQERMNRP